MTIESNTSIMKKDTNNKFESQKYLTFFLENEEYGIEINKVIEIIGEMPIVPIPKLPEFFKGVINLRGRIVPVMDLRLKLGMTEQEMTEESVIIIVQTNKHDMGLIVDKVTEVLDIRADDIEESPEFGTSIETEYIIGMAKMNNSIKILLEIDRVISTEQLDNIKQLSSNPEENN